MSECFRTSARSPIEWYYNEAGVLSAGNGGGGHLLQIKGAGGAIYYYIDIHVFCKAN